MSKGIFTAVSGAIAQSAKLDTIANNLANVSTPGFKRDGQLFKEYLTAYEKEPNTNTVPRIPASIESFYDMQGTDKSFVDVNGTYTDFQQGSLKTTGNKLDVAIDGEGFFEVGTPDGVRLTRVGSFSVDSDGRLVTKQGYPVLAEGDAAQGAAGREIRINGANISIGENGEIFDGDQKVAKLGMVQVENKDALLKVGRNLYDIKSNLDPKMSVANKASVHQGFLEGSNVNPIQEMTDMIAATRIFESTQKAIKAYDEMLGKAVTEVPKLQG